MRIIFLMTIRKYLNSYLYSDNTLVQIWYLFHMRYPTGTEIWDLYMRGAFRHVFFIKRL